MSYRADTSGAQRKLEAFVQGIKEEMPGIANFARARIGARAGSSYMRDAGVGAGRRAPDDQGPLRIVTGRLFRSLVGARYQGRYEGILNVKSTTGGFRIEIGSKVRYAAVHERGYPEGGIPARPYAVPAAQKEASKITREARKRLSEMARNL